MMYNATMERKLVLAIEHDWRMRKLIRANLEAVGLAVQEAVSIPHGLLLIRKSQPALILLDLDMPDADISDLMDELDAHLSHHPAPIILLSPEPPERFLRRHHLITGHLQKPFAISMLLQQVEWALEGSAVDR
jgi:CheY-like chemotaxis protein